MIVVDRINDKGEKVQAYTHQSYLSKHFNSEVERLTRNYQTRNQVFFYGSTILSYWAFNNVSVLNQIISSKLHMKGRFLISSFAVGYVVSCLAGLPMSSSLRSSYQNLLKNEIFPAWWKKEKVVNPDRVFFELDDNHHNEPTIWHSSISESAINRIIPDFIVGTPNKPHYPVAEHHHH